jgi:hypothetical protein
LSEVEEVRLSGVPGPGMIDFRNFIPGVLDAPTPLIRLESFSLRAAPIREIYAQGDEIVLRWSAGNGGTHYEVETASGFEEPLLWNRVPLQPTLSGLDWILANQVTVPAAFYRIRLLDP